MSRQTSEIRASAALPPPHNTFRSTLADLTMQSLGSTLPSFGKRSQSLPRSRITSLKGPMLPKLFENQSKFIQDRVALVERHFGVLCSGVGSIARKNAKLRDKGDEFAKSVLDYADGESLNHTAKSALTQFSENISTVEDYRQALIQRLEAKVIEPLGLYGTTCKLAKDDLKAAFAARDKEQKQQKTLEKVKDKNPSNTQQISQAETELQKASVDASWTSRALEEKMDGFEKKKLVDLKTILMDYVQVEMLFHAKALELHTEAFQSLQLINEDEDLEEFRNSLRPPSATSRLGMVQANSKTSLNSTSQSLRSGKPTPSVPRSKKVNNNNKRVKDRQQPKQSSMYGNIEDDDDDDEDDDDEDDDEDDTDENDYVPTRKR